MYILFSSFSKEEIHIKHCRRYPGLLVITLSCLGLITTLLAPALALGTPVDVTLYVDGIQSTLASHIVRGENDRLLVEIGDAAQILSCQAEMADNSQVVFSQGSTDVSFRVGGHYVLHNDLLVDLDSSPVIINDQIFVPLRAAAECFGYTIVFDQRTAVINLYSPGTPVPSLVVPPSDPPADLPVWGRIADTDGLSHYWANEILVGSYYTTLLSSASGRTANVRLSCQEINGRIVAPGQVFSFNQATGQRTTARGYQVAPIFAGKKVVPGVGGGVCQTSSTLYNAVLDAGLPVVQRYPHTLRVDYVPRGYDATVSWGGADFQFRNDRSAPVKILAQVYGKYVMCAIAEVR